MNINTRNEIEKELRKQIYKSKLNVKAMENSMLDRYEKGKIKGLENALEILYLIDSKELDYKNKVIEELKKVCIEESKKQFGDKFIENDDLDLNTENYINYVISVYIGNEKDYKFAYDNIEIFKRIIKYGLNQDEINLLKAIDEITESYKVNRKEI